MLRRTVLPIRVRLTHIRTSPVSNHPAFFAFAFDEMAGEQAQTLQAAIERELGQTCYVKAPTSTTEIAPALQAVEQSQCLLLLQTGRVLSRPWVLLATYRAIFCNVPIVCVQVANGGYDFAHARIHLEQLDDHLSATEHEQLTAVLANCEPPHVTSVAEIGQQLNSVVPSLISVKYDASGSESELRAASRDVWDKMNLGSRAQTTARGESLSVRTLRRPTIVGKISPPFKLHLARLRKARSTSSRNASSTLPEVALTNLWLDHEEVV